MLKLDKFDLKLLQVVQENNLLTSDQLASRVHLSGASCLRRLKRLRKQGVISEDTAVVNPEAAGIGLMSIVLVSLERERLDTLERFKEAMLRAPEVVQCLYVTGDVDFVLMVAAADMSAYETFTQRILFSNKNVRRFTTLVVMKRVKFGTTIPIKTG
ncbi:MAG: Lrp/AsnC family transcriptional regulator [Candidatus Korobacteraceae bacterium]|jgi:Lrp/AsnC family leucine-responsive transcriptional regulator